MAHFHVVTFGPSSEGLWNHHSLSYERQAWAERYALNCLSIGGVTGYVVIKETEDAWEIVDEVGIKGKSIAAMHSWPFYKVEVAPELVLV